jgi:hypothetical protein
MSSNTLDLTLQFQFDTSGALSTTVVSVLSTMVKATDVWTCPWMQWSSYEQVRVQVKSLEPPAGLAYALLINGERQSIQGDYFWCTLGLLGEGISFAVEASHRRHQHGLAVRFAPDPGYVDRRKKVPIVIKVTTEPPPTNPIGSTIDDLAAPLLEMENLLKKFRDRLTRLEAFDGAPRGPR